MHSERIDSSAASSRRMNSPAWLSTEALKNLIATTRGGTSGASLSGSIVSATHTMPKAPAPMRW